MTATYNDRRVRYVATAGQTEFDVDFNIDSYADIEVWQKVDATGVISLLTYGAGNDYTVTLDGAAPNTALVTLTSGAALSDIIAIEGSRTPARTSDFSTGGDFFAGTVNSAEDRQYWHLQELLRDLGRSITLNRTTSDSFDATLPDPVASAVLAFTSDALGLQTISGLSSVAVSTAMEAVVTAATVAAARTALGLGTAAVEAATAFETADPDILKADTTDDLSVGFPQASASSYGEIADAATLTVDLTKPTICTATLPAAGGGTHAVAPPAAKYGVQVIEITNGATGPTAITYAGFDDSDGSPSLDAAAVNRAYCLKGPAGSKITWETVS